LAFVSAAMTARPAVPQAACVPPPVAYDPLDHWSQKTTIFAPGANRLTAYSISLMSSNANEARSVLVM